MANNSYKKEFEQARIDIGLIVQDLSKVEKSILDLSETARKSLKDAFSVNNLQKFNDLVNRASTVLNQLNTQSQKLANTQNNLNQEQKKINRLTLMERDTRQKSLRSLKLQVTANNKLVSSYERLRAQQRSMKAELDRLTASYGKNSQQALRMQRAYDKATGKVNKANRSFLMLSRGGIRGAIGGLRNLAGAFGLIGGAGIVADLIPKMFNLSKQFESFRFTMEKTIGSAYEMVEAQEFLDDITDRYGANLLSTTERFIKFDAAARQSNLSFQDTTKIFDAVTKASGVLGLKTDELTGVYLALEQMLSKGKVTTEELRRQLGERLPGAFGIMANALGISVAKLDEMLKKGQILSSEALPKFAVELQKAYGIESVKTIETLQAAQTRLSNAWQKFVRDLTGDDTLLQNTFKGVLNFMSGLLETIKDISDEISDAFESEAEKQFEKARNSFAKLEKAQIEGLMSIEDASDRVNAALTERTRLEENLAKKMEEQGKYTYQGVEYSISQQQAANETRKLFEEMAAFNGSAADAQKFIDNLSQSYVGLEQNTIATAFARVKGIDFVVEKGLEEIELQKKKLEGDKKDKKVTREKVKTVYAHAKGVNSLVHEVKKEIKLYEDALEITPKMTKEYEYLQTKIKQLYSVLSGIETDEVNEEIKEWGKNFKKQVDEAAKAGRELSDIFNDFMDSSLADLFGNAGFDRTFDMFIKKGKDGKTMFEELHKEAKRTGRESEFVFKTITESMAEGFNFASDIAGQFFDNNIQRYQDEIEANADYYAQLLDNQELTVQQRDALEAERDRKRRNLEKKQRAEERKKIQMQKAVSVFETIINTKSAIVEALPDIPLSIAVGLIGAANLAAILSTPLPRYFKGRGISDDYEGPMVWGEQRQEVKINTKTGKMELSPKNPGNHVGYVTKDDIIYPDAKKLFEGTTNVENINDFQKDALTTIIMSDGKSLDQYILQQSFDRSITNQTRQMVKGFDQVMQKKKMKVNVYNTINIDERIKYNKRGDF